MDKQLESREIKNRSTKEREKSYKRQRVFRNKLKIKFKKLQKTSYKR